MVFHWTPFFMLFSCWRKVDYANSRGISCLFYPSRTRGRDPLWQLADAMESCGNGEVGRLFRRLADYSRLHLADAQARSGFREIPAIKTGDYVWPGWKVRRRPRSGRRSLIGREQALEIALDAETAGFEYYKNILEATGDPEIKALAKEFVAERAAMWPNSKNGSPRIKPGNPCRLIFRSVSLA